MTSKLADRDMARRMLSEPDAVDRFVELMYALNIELHTYEDDDLESAWTWLIADALAGPAESVCRLQQELRDTKTLLASADARAAMEYTLREAFQHTLNEIVQQDGPAEGDKSST